MKIKANILSLTFKVIGACLVLSALALNGFGIWHIAMQEVVVGVLVLEGLFLPIDISKMRENKHQEK